MFKLISKCIEFQGNFNIEYLVLVTKFKMLLIKFIFIVICSPELGELIELSRHLSVFAHFIASTCVYLKQCANYKHIYLKPHWH